MNLNLADLLQQPPKLVLLGTIPKDREDEVARLSDEARTDNTNLGVFLFAKALREMLPESWNYVPATLRVRTGPNASLQLYAIQIPPPELDPEDENLILHDADLVERVLRAIHEERSAREAGMQLELALHRRMYAMIPGISNWRHVHAMILLPKGCLLLQGCSGDCRGDDDE